MSRIYNGHIYVKLELQNNMRSEILTLQVLFLANVTNFHGLPCIACRRNTCRIHDSYLLEYSLGIVSQLRCVFQPIPNLYIP